MSKIPQVNAPIIGMDTDKHPINLDAKQYPFALNANIENETGNGIPLIQNEHSNLLCVNFSPFVVIGVQTIPEKDITIFFLVNPETSVSKIVYINSLKVSQDVTTNNDNITYCDDCEPAVEEDTPLEDKEITPICTYTEIVEDSCAVLGFPLDKTKWLNFSIDNPIVSTYKIDNCSITLYWCDGDRNPMRYLNLDVDDFQKNIPRIQIGTEADACETPIYSDCIDVEKIRVFPHVDPVCVKVIDIGTGGSLRAGSYQFAIAYADKVGETLSSYMSVTNPTPIFDPKYTITVDTDYVTDKSIRISFSNLDTDRFRYFNLIAIKSINRVLTFEMVGTFTSTTDQYVYTGNDKTARPITIQDVLQKYPFYENANTVTNANNHLLWGGVTSDREINWQPIGIRLGQLGAVKWQTVRADEDFYANPIATANYRSYMRDEVYPIALAFLLRNGQQTCAINIPGRPSNSVDTEFVGLPENNDHASVTEKGCFPAERNMRWQIYNTGSVQNFAPCFSPTDNTITQTQTLYCFGLPYFSDAGVPDDAFGDNGDFYFDTGTNDWYEKTGGSWVIMGSPPEVECSISIYPAGCGTPILIGCSPEIYVPAHTESITVYSESVTVTVPAANEDCEMDLFLGTLQSNLTCNDAIGLFTSPTSDCTIRTYGYVLENVDAPTPGCAGDDNNQVWFKFIPTSSTILALTIQSPDNLTIEVYDSCGGTIIDYYDPADAADPNATPIGTACFSSTSPGLYKILSHLTINQAYYIKVYSPTQDASTSCFALCITTPQGTPETIDIPAKYRNKCEYEVECQVDVSARESCVATPYEWGHMSYHESTEKYPDNELLYRELACQPIRHHKFPDNCVTHIHDQLGQNVVYGTENKIFPIGIRIDVPDIKAAIEWAVTNGIITDEDRKSIVGYKILRGNRVGHKSVIAKGLLYDMYQYTNSADPDNPKTIHYPNYPFNDLRPDPFLLNNGSPIPHPFENGEEDFADKENYRYTFHSPDTHFNNPTLGTELKFENVEYGFARGGFTNVKEHAKFVLIRHHTVVVAGIIAGTQTALDVFANLYPALIQGVAAGSISFGAGSAAATGLFIAGIVAEALMTAFSSFFTYFHRWVEVIRGMGKPQQFGYFYSAVGRYSGFCCELAEGSKLRWLDNAVYLQPISLELQEINETQPTTINNWSRESSVYFNIGADFPIPRPDYFCPDNIDTSRVLNSEQGNCTTTDIDTQISSYYVSLKNYVPDQYGTIDSIQYLDTGFCGVIDWNDPNQDNSCETAFGGDIFISRFALKRKLAYFTFNAIGLTEDSEISYSLYPNITTPAYWFDTIATPTIAAALFGIVEPETHFDCYDDFHDPQDFYYMPPAKMYLFSYGIPYFICESDYNTNYRYGENTRERNFYPNAGDVREWTQETIVPISEDNYYFYNRDYSKQNRENFFCIPDVTFDGDRNCRTVHDNRVIYSLQDLSNEDIVDSWLSYKANDYYDFARANGRLVSLENIENNKVLVRFENTSQVFNAYATLAATPHEVQVGSGSMFAQKPQEYTKTPLGFGGSQNRAFVATELGYFWVDAKRGEVFRLPIGGALEPIGRKGMKNWFKENLPFNIVKDFPTYDTDNNYKDIGITMGWDTRYQRVFLTKKDYRLLPDKVGKVTFDGEKFLDGEIEISLFNANYFCDKSWTIAYSPLTDTWLSFYSFKPNYYVSHNGYFQTGINYAVDDTELGLWSHLLTNRSYQVFYGDLHPFIIEMVTKEQLQTKFLQSIEFQEDTLRYQNEYDFRPVPLTFNKAVIYSESINSGLLELVPQQTNNLAQSLLYPQQNANSTSILVTLVEGTWKLNGFYNLVRSTNVPIWLNNCANYDKELNQAAMNYSMPTFERNRLRANYFKIRLINDQYSNYKFQMKWLVNESGKSIN